MLARAHTLHWLLAHHQAGTSFQRTKALLAAFDIIVVTLTPRDMSNTSSRGEAASGPSPGIPGRRFVVLDMDAAQQQVTLTVHT